MDQRDEPSPEQIEILRRMTPEQRYRAGRALYWTLRKHKRAFLRSVRPDWTDSQLDAEVGRIFLHAQW